MSSGAGGPAGRAGADHRPGAGRGRAEQSDSARMYLRPYVSLPEGAPPAGPEAEAEAGPLDAEALFGPGGPMDWSIEDIWGPRDAATGNSGRSGNAPGDAAGAPPEPVERADGPGRRKQPGAGGQRPATSGGATPPHPGRSTGAAHHGAQPRGHEDGRGPADGQGSPGRGGPASPAPQGAAAAPAPDAKAPSRPRPGDPDTGQAPDGAAGATDRTQVMGTPAGPRTVPDSAVAAATAAAATAAAAAATATLDADTRRIPRIPGGADRGQGPVVRATQDGAEGPGGPNGRGGQDGPAPGRHGADAPGDSGGRDDGYGTADSADQGGPETVAEHRAHARHRRPRRFVVLTAVGAAAAIACVAVFAGGLFSDENQSHDDALPGADSTAAAPGTDPTAPAATAAVPGAPPAAVQPPSARGATGSAASGSATPTDAVPLPPSAATSSAPAGSTASAPPPAVSGPAVLRAGDQGTEVKELELRLRQLLLYLDKADGVYGSGLEKAVARYQNSRKIDGDEHGVYGPATRQRLESETSEP